MPERVETLGVSLGFDPDTPSDMDEMPRQTVPEKAIELETAVALARRLAPHLSESDAADLELQVDALLALSGRLQGPSLPHGSEPDFVFQAMHPRERHL